MPRLKRLNSQSIFIRQDMGQHPLNLLFRFILEIFALVSIGMWGWSLGDNSFKYVLALVLPLIIAMAWGIFAVPDDPSRSGNAPVAISGKVRLLLELGIFGFACWILFNLGYPNFAYALLLSVLLHYLISYDRILWLLNQ